MEDAVDLLVLNVIQKKTEQVINSGIKLGFSDEDITKNAEEEVIQIK